MFCVIHSHSWHVCMTTCSTQVQNFFFLLFDFYRIRFFFSFFLFLTKISLKTSGGRSISGFPLKSKCFSLPSMQKTLGTNSTIELSAKLRRLKSQMTNYFFFSGQFVCYNLLLGKDSLMHDDRMETSNFLIYGCTIWIWAQSSQR